LIIRKTPGPALFRAPDLRPANNSLISKAREASLSSISLTVMDINPIPAFWAQDYMSRVLTKYTVVLEFPTLITAAITGINPVTL
jgi:hypothetical protein